MHDTIPFYRAKPVPGASWFVRIRHDTPSLGFKADDVIELCPVDRVDCDARFQLVTGELALFGSQFDGTYLVRAADGADMVIPAAEAHGMVTGRVIKQYRECRHPWAEL